MRQFKRTYQEMTLTMSELTAPQTPGAPALRGTRVPSDTAAAVHDLAQPLSVVASSTELLVADWEHLTESDRRDLAMRIDRGVRRLADTLRRIDAAAPVGAHGPVESGRR
jgi:hypothetical protein